MEDIKENDSGLLHCYSCASEIGIFEWKETSCKDCGNEIPFTFLLQVDILTFVFPPSIVCSLYSPFSVISNKNLICRNKNVQQVVLEAQEIYGDFYQVKS